MYRHTQMGWWLIVAMVAPLLAAVAALIHMGLVVGPPQGEEWIGVYACTTVAIVLAACAILFHSLTVQVDDDAVRIHFGPGLIHKTWRVADIASCAMVRNPWYAGWGIHRLPRYWVFNVAGLDAVELQLRDGRRHRIGTDEPAELCRAIESRLPQQAMTG